MAELRKHGDFTLQRKCKSGWKVVLQKQLSMFYHQSTGMERCVPWGAARGLGLFNTSTNDLNDKTESMLIMSTDDASRGRETHPLENRSRTENDLTNKAVAPTTRNFFNRTEGSFCLRGT